MKNKLENWYVKLSDVVLAMYVVAVCLFMDGSIYIQMARIVLFCTFLIYVYIDKSIVINQYEKWMLVFTAYSVISICYSYNDNVAVSGTKSVIVNCLTMVALVQIVKRSINWTDIVTKMLIIAPILFGLYFFATQGIDVFTGSRFIAESGFNANTLGTMSAIGAVLAFFVLKCGIIGIVNNVLYKGMLIVNFIFVLLSGSKKSLLFLFLPLIIYMLIKTKSPQKLIKSIIWLLLVFVVVIIIIMNVPFFYNIIGGRIVGFIQTLMGEGKDASTTFRILLLKWGTDWFCDRPILGYGTDNFRALVGQYDTWAGSAGTYAHNNFLEILVDFGLIGFVIYYFIYFKILTKIVESIRKKDELRMIYGSIFLTNLIGELATVSYVNKYSNILLATTWCIMFLNNITCIEEKNNEKVIKCGSINIQAS